MNDRFRFRVWYNPQPTYGDYPKMLYDAENAYDYMGASELIPADCFGEILEDKNFIVMQCTGLKDKNGKLIYEGDIVKNKYADNYIVSWNNKGFWQMDTYAIAGFNNLIQEEMQVIGNIYENKELLEVEE